MRILIAEDDPVSRLRLESILKKWGYDPMVSRDGREALAILEREPLPEIAILDWMMPEIDGTEVCRRIWGKPSGAGIYILLLTAKTQREDIIAGLAAGADDYIAKPFDLRELHARLQVGIRVTTLQSQLAERVRELEVALLRLRGLQQAQKLEALGQMAAGVAHEINTPAQYIDSNIRFLRDSWRRLKPTVVCALRVPRIHTISAVRIAAKKTNALSGPLLNLSGFSPLPIRVLPITKIAPPDYSSVAGKEEA